MRPDLTEGVVIGVVFADLGVVVFGARRRRLPHEHEAVAHQDEADGDLGRADALDVEAVAVNLGADALFGHARRAAVLEHLDHSVGGNSISHHTPQSLGTPASPQ